MLERIGSSEIVACLEISALESYRRNLEKDFRWTVDSARMCAAMGKGKESIAYQIGAFRAGVLRKKIQAVKAEVRKLQQIH